MNATIWKYQLRITADQIIRVPKHATFLSVNNQYDNVYVWFMVDPAQSEMADISVKIVGTGHPIDTRELPSFRGTVLSNNGQLVWHIFL